MSATEILQLSTAPITAFSFNAKRDKVALCPNTNEVQIFEKAGNEWKLADTLQGHDKLVTSIDWAPKTNRIVTCSQDRNAYVWTIDPSTNEWKPTLVLLRINRAATFVRWSPLENKFAVASGSRCISVCYFEEDRDWWVSKHLKKPIRSTVLCVEWHPNNVLLAAGSSDMKARVFSAYIKGVDEKPPASPWGERLPFNTLCAEYSSGYGAWVHGVKFSPDGNYLAWVSHDSTFCVADPAKNHVSQVPGPFLPFLDLEWVSSNSIVCVGHDCCPMLFSASGNGWQFVEKLDGQAEKKKVGGNSAFDKFKQMDSRAQADNSSSGTLQTVHQNSINGIRLHVGNKDKVLKFATCGIDGKIVIWDVKSLEQAIAGLKIA